MQRLAQLIVNALQSTLRQIVVAAHDLQVRRQVVALTDEADAAVNEVVHELDSLRVTEQSIPRRQSGYSVRIQHTPLEAQCWCPSIDLCFMQYTLTAERKKETKIAEQWPLQVELSKRNE